MDKDLRLAAEEAMPESYGFLEVDIYGGTESVYSREQMLEMFLAGAEWQKVQFKELLWMLMMPQGGWGEDN